MLIKYNVFVKKWAFVSVAALLTGIASAGNISDPSLVFLQPEKSSFWHTATNRVMTLPVSFPSGASSATLTITGAFGYASTIEEITGDSVTVTLPEPVFPVKGESTEDVYDLTLEFDDGSRQSARLALVAGLDADGEGFTRCLAPSSASAWSKAPCRAVVPVPYGMASFAVDGESVDTGLGGAAGWYALSAKPDETVTLSGSVEGELCAVSLKGLFSGFILFIK